MPKKFDIVIKKKQDSADLPHSANSDTTNKAFTCKNTYVSQSSTDIGVIKESLVSIKATDTNQVYTLNKLEKKSKISKKKKKPLMQPSATLAISGSLSAPHPQTIPTDISAIGIQSTIPSLLPKQARIPVKKPSLANLNHVSDPIERNRIQREVEMNQVVTRFNKNVYCTVRPEGSGDLLAVGLVPSDPDFPFELRVLDLQIIVPALYPTARPLFRVLTNEIPDKLRRNLEYLIKEKVGRTKFSLLQYLNWIDRDLESMLVEREEMKIVLVRAQALTVTSADDKDSNDEFVDFHDESDDEYYDETAKTLITENEQESGIKETMTTDQNTTNVSMHRNPAIGTQLKLINPNFTNISTVKCPSLAIVVLCNRCKNRFSIEKLSTNFSSPTDTRITDGIQCSNCHSVSSARYRGELMHQYSNCIGYLDLIGCKMFDLLPVSMIACCTKCDNETCFTNVIPGQIQRLNCQKCHQQLSVNYEQVKISSFGTGLIESTSQRPMKKKDAVHLNVGQALDKNGTCKHYKRSFRWLRFPCCGQLFPCDKCHDELSKDRHEMQYATRMVCGFCSREMPFSNEKLVCVCGQDLVKKRDGKGFWEGGKGTRNTVLMSRKDGRKYKNTNKTKSMKSTRVGND